MRRSMLEVADHNRVLHLRVAEPVAVGEPALQLAFELLDACEEIEARVDPPLAVALTSQGSAFWVLPPASPDDLDAFGDVWAAATAAIGRLGPPTVAAVGADALGPAWDLALACDLRFIADEARVGHPEIRWGRLPVGGGLQRLARVAGPFVAMRLALLGETPRGPEACRLALTHGSAPADRLGADLEALLDALRAASPTALAYAKEAVSRSAHLPLAEGLRLEADLAALLMTTADRAEGLAAFRERRAPRFEGR